MDINPQTADFSEYGKRVCVMPSTKPLRVINLAYFPGSNPPRGRFAACRRPPDRRAVTSRRRR
jgi:hypothetical protein